MTGRPRFTQVFACEQCVFLGTFRAHDLYWCPQPPALGLSTVIGRFGNCGGDYVSGMEFARMGVNEVLVEALRRAVALGHEAP